MHTYNKTTRMRAAAAGLVVAVLGTSACGLLDVTNPGLIEDETLDDPAFAAALVAGMSADYARALNRGQSNAVPILGLELTSGRSNQAEYTERLDPDLVGLAGLWQAWQRSRWVASAGIERLKESLGAGYDGSRHAAAANLWAGFSNRLLGELVCNAVIDGGPAQPREAHFPIAEAYFSEAARIAQAAGLDEIYYAALGGRASMRAWQGDWGGAEEDAILVPASFMFEAQFSFAGEQNSFWGTVFSTRYLTVDASMWVDVTDDPRVPWIIARDDQGEILPTRGGDWRSFLPSKYPAQDSNVPTTHGAEMLVLRAEAALRAGDLAGMTSLLNESRALPKWDMDPLPVPASVDEAWEVFKYERLATLWLESRAFWDKARWYDEGRDDSLEGRFKCVPIGRGELDSNPNLAEFG